MHIYSVCRLLKDAFIIILFFYLSQRYGMRYENMYRHSDMYVSYQPNAAGNMGCSIFVTIQYIIICSKINYKWKTKFLMYFGQ